MVLEDNFTDLLLDLLLGFLAILRTEDVVGSFACSCPSPDDPVLVVLELFLPRLYIASGILDDSFLVDPCDTAQVRRTNLSDQFFLAVLVFRIVSKTITGIISTIKSLAVTSGMNKLMKCGRVVFLVANELFWLGEVNFVS